MEPIGDHLKNSLHVQRLKKRVAERQAWLNAQSLRNRPLAALYPDECRVKCLDCRGWGLFHPAEAEACALCIAATEPCAEHKCHTCDGSGLVCPDCRGMRRVRVPHKGELPCPTCREGNNVNDYREANAITAYLDKGNWQTLSPEQLRAHRKEVNRKAVEAAEAYHSEWMRMTGTRYGLDRRKDKWQETSKAIEEKYGPPVPIDELLKIGPEPKKREKRT